MAEALFSSQGSSDVLSRGSCDMKEIIAMWDPRPGDNSLGPDFRNKAPEEVASLEQKFECAQGMLLQRTSSLGKREFSALMGSESSRHSLELNGGTPKLLKSDSSKDSLSKRDFPGMIGEGSLQGIERSGPSGGVRSESSRDGADRDAVGGPTSFAGLFMPPPLHLGPAPVGLHALRTPPALLPLPPFPRPMPSSIGRSVPPNATLPTRVLPVPPVAPPVLPAIKSEFSGSVSIDSERSSDGPGMSADPSVHGSSGFRRLEGKAAGGSGRTPGDSRGGAEMEKGEDPDPQKTQREKNMLKSRRHRLRKKAQETLLREKIVKLEAELAGLRGEFNRVATEGRREILRLQEENVRLRTELSRRASAPLRDARPAASRGPVSPSEEIEKLQAENRTLKEGYRNVLATMNELMQTKAG